MITRSDGTTPARNVDDLVADVAKYEYGLDASHCLLGNMRFKLPADQQLCVVVFDDMGAPYGQSTFLDTDPASPFAGLEVQQATLLHAVRAEFFGFIDDQGNDAAKSAALRAAGAFAGLYAQQLQGQYGVSFGRAQAPIPAHETEETALLVKYVVHLSVTAMHQTVKAPPPGADYFDKFNGAQSPVNPSVPSSMPGPAVTLQE